MTLTLKRLADAAWITLLVTLALAPMIPVFTLPAIIVPGLGGVVLGAVVAAFAAWRRFQPLLTMALMLAAYLLFGPAMAVPEYASHRVIPTLRAEEWLVVGSTGVWRRLLTVEVPIGPGGGFGLAPFLLAYVGTAVGASLAVRLSFKRAGFAALAPLMVATVSVVLGARESVLALPLGLLTGVGAVTWVAWRSKTLQPRRMVALVVTGSLACGAGLGGAVLAQARDRLVVREEVAAPFDPRDYPSPLSGYRRYIKDDLKSKVLLRVDNLPAGGVVKLAVMDRFDGVVWNVAGGGESDASGNFGRMPVGTPVPDSHRMLLQSHDTKTPWLYSVGEPWAVNFAGPDGADLREALRFNPVTWQMALPPAPPDGVTYVVESPWGQYRPSDDQIARAEAGAALVPSYVKVQAADMKAASATRDATTAGAKALALEQYLQNGYYSDGQEGATEGAGKVEALAGHGADRVTSLLNADIMVGDAEQYASAMALMARSQGLPARVVMGYAPGYGEQPAPNATHQGPQGDGAKAGSYTFTGGDMTAWVEVNLAGLGWVPFFPTPNRQDSPEDAETQQDPEPEPQVIQPPPQEAKPSEPPDEDMAPVPVGSAKPLPPEKEPFVISAALAWAGGGVGLLLLVLGLAALIILAKARRRSRRRRRGPPSHQIVAGWEEVLDMLQDLHLSPLNADLVAMTRSEAAAKAPPEARSLLRRLAGESDAAAFGSLALGEQFAVNYWTGVESVSKSLTQGLSPWRRLRAKLSLASFRYRRWVRRHASNS
ncbi:MAG: hypothetical protein LBH68_04330 [Bifidobacteriaceae bacterium]|jgi:hypothetical protein|nr:hypothetical protein [Bifidobacteriaceae bacterium]